MVLSGPASILQGQVVTGLKLAEAKGRELTPFENDDASGNKYQFMSEILKWRSINMPDHVIFSQVGSKVMRRLIFYFTALTVG